ncbi:hypothetical protein LTR10_014139 [Elasticomyces elasticus]|nr:hypothetical protein LTR10_014139 [Elasticomyces elasticus]KAK5026545.1 hypothetical protein LTS07_007479 [Exophiala sideris]KAK5180080.1 hypothetical protein LTR44_007556 [Eurotiomycetes sp. CCFEE 6388]
MIVPARHNAVASMFRLAGRRGLKPTKLANLSTQAAGSVPLPRQTFDLGASHLKRPAGHGCVVGGGWRPLSTLPKTWTVQTSQTNRPQIRLWTQLRSSSTQPQKGNDLEKDSSTTSSKPKLTTLLPRLPKTVHENIYTIPNILTFTRLLAAPAVGYLILHSQPFWALTLFFYAGVTDLVDGYLARRFNSQTVVGTVIDPMADKALMTIAVVTLTINGTLPIWLAVIILGRDVALAISAIYFRWISLPPPKTMARYWDFSLPSAEVHPTEISKINTFLQLLLIGNAMLLPVLPEALVHAYNLTGVFEGWSYLVACTTIWSGLSYIGNREAVKILSSEEIDEQMAQRQKSQEDEKK